MRTGIRFILFSLLFICFVHFLQTPARSQNSSAEPSLSLPGQIKKLRIDSKSAFTMLQEQVAIGPRPAGSPGAAACAAYIAAKIRQFGLEPVVDEWTGETPAGPVTFRNIYAEVKGRAGYGDSFILLASHYDTKHLKGIPAFTGANDSASSTALLLEILRVVAANGPWDGMPLRFAFFDGEEAVVSYTENDGLYGSRRLAADFVARDLARRCRAMILLDMVGDKDLSLTLPQNSSRELVGLLLRVADEQNVKHIVSVLPTAILDDHVSFAALGIPAIDLIDFHYGSNNKYWHTAGDNLSNVSGASLETVGNLVFAMLGELGP
jgi:glutaminyl-peptide cyclotransferase